MLSEVVGQEEGVYFLRRVVEGHYTSPLLLVGDEGVGRRFSALHAVKEAFCSGTKEKGCGCIDCLQLDKGIHPDLTVVLPEGEKDIGVDVVREIIGQSDNAPVMAPHRMFIIDGADRLTAAAANAFLKTLEEPSPRVRFFLLAESNDRVLPTIRSRCGRVAYRTLPQSFVLSVIQQYESDPAKALVYAMMGEGSVGRSIRYWGSGRLGLRDRVFSLLQLALAGEPATFFPSIDALSKDLPLGLRFLEQILHDVLMAPLDPTRLINSDIAEGIAQVRSAKPLSVWVKLSRGVKGVSDRYRRTRINLAFHVKTLFAETFLGV